MTAKYWICFLIVLTISIVSCDKDDEIICDTLVDVPEPEQWERFVGDYLVYDTLGNFSHEMSIIHFYSDSDQPAQGTDSMRITNLNNQFTFNFKFSNTFNKNILSIDPITTLFNHDGHRFYFWHNSDDPETIENENRLENDTIYLSFFLDNTLYWSGDGIPYYTCQCREIAVKQD